MGHAFEINREQFAAFQIFLAHTLEPVDLHDEDDDGADVALIAEPKTGSPTAGAALAA